MGVCIHKLQLHFIPYVANHSIEIAVDATAITSSSLFFVQNDLS
jgi:hypothetical protein